MVVENDCCQNNVNSLGLARWHDSTTDWRLLIKHPEKSIDLRMSLQRGKWGQSGCML
jgi:hypothetical protein